ncbi:MAG: tripartite tricarboxylate transporter substrate binding protein [Deltaproteobacteria bacterium]|nr:tripartite tricarboxylate transporter substrate binding protein [Deltaproteobacteria bacterium]
MKKSIIWKLVLICLVLPYLCGQAWGQAPYPSKPIDLIVPYNPGGGADLTARLLSGYFSKKMGVQLNVINKPGAGGIIGAREVLTARPDGYTMLCDGHATSSMLAAFQPGELPFDWRKRTWIARMTKDPVIYQVRMDGPWRTLKEVAEYIKKNPKQLRWGATGVSGVGSPAGIQFFRAENISLDMVNRVMFSGESPVLAALAGGHIDFTGQQYGPSWGLIEGQKNRPIAVIAERRLPLLKDVPTVAEAGYPMLDVHGWHGLSGPPSLSKPVVDFWVRELEKAQKDPMFHEMAEKVKKEVAYLNSKEMEAFAVKEYEKYLALAKDVGAK